MRKHAKCPLCNRPIEARGLASRVLEEIAETVIPYRLSFEGRGKLAVVRARAITLSIFIIRMAGPLLYVSLAWLLLGYHWQLEAALAVPLALGGWFVLWWLSRRLGRGTCPVCERPILVTGPSREALLDDVKHILERVTVKRTPSEDNTVVLEVRDHNPAISLLRAMAAALYAVVWVAVGTAILIYFERHPLTLGGEWGLYLSALAVALMVYLLFWGSFKILGTPRHPMDWHQNEGA